MNLRAVSLGLLLSVTYLFTPSFTSAEEKRYVVLDDLQRLKDDFNTKVGTVRLVFIIGPTCGVCLRGMADLNDEFLAAYQSDPRLQTFAVHVPTLGAEEKHVEPTIDLMKGQRIYHYWDGGGTIGVKYQEVLEAKAYAWDVWFIYGPEAVWDGDLPPAPAFWQHQLSIFPRELKLDKKTFAKETLARVNQLDLADFDAAPVAASANPLADGAVIPMVAQGYGRAINQYVDTRGGTQAIRDIEKRVFEGQLIIGDETFDLTVTEQRPNMIEKRAPSADYSLKYDGDKSVVREGHLSSQGVPLEVEGHLMGYFDFDTPLIDWSDKGHKFTMQGMEKAGDVLAWNLVQTDPDGQKWTYLIDSHRGDIVRMQAFDKEGKLLVSVHYSDYKKVDDMPTAHTITYRDANGKLLAQEKFDKVRHFKKGDS